MSEYFDEADVATAIDEAERNEAVLVKVASTSKEIGPVMVTIEHRADVDIDEALGELFGAMAAALHSYAQHMEAITGIPFVVHVALVAKSVLNAGNGGPVAEESTKH